MTTDAEAVFVPGRGGWRPSCLVIGPGRRLAWSRGGGASACDVMEGRD